MKQELKEERFSGSWLPNLITTGNLFSGFAAILLISNYKIEIAAWLILLAVICDSLDGNVARALKNTNVFGRELDSLADIVSFVVAPAFLVCKSWPAQFQVWTLLVAFFYLWAGTYRLARFNVKPPVKTHFEGLPTPAAAVIVAMAAIAYQKNEWAGILSHMIDRGILMIACGFLMMSRIPYPKFSGIKFSKWQLIFYLGSAVFISVGLLVNFETAIASLFFLFMLLPIVYHPKLMVD